MKSLKEWVDAERSKVNKKIYKKVVEAQLSCKHEKIAECDYEKTPLGTTYKPFRVCMICGFAEEGWYCGNQILIKKHLDISREEGYKHVIGAIHNNGKFVRVSNIRDKKKLYEMAVMEFER